MLHTGCICAVNLCLRNVKVCFSVLSCHPFPSPQALLNRNDLTSCISCFSSFKWKCAEFQYLDDLTEVSFPVLRSDKTLQDIVYKLVPGLFKSKSNVFPFTPTHDAFAYFLDQLLHPHSVRCNVTAQQPYYHCCMIKGKGTRIYISYHSTSKQTLVI